MCRCDLYAVRDRVTCSDAQTSMEEKDRRTVNIFGVPMLAFGVISAASLIYATPLYWRCYNLGVAVQKACCETFNQTQTLMCIRAKVHLMNCVRKLSLVY